MVDGSTAGAPTDERDTSLLQKRNVDLLPWVLRAEIKVLSVLCRTSASGRAEMGEDTDLVAAEDDALCVLVEEEHGQRRRSVLEKPLRSERWRISNSREADRGVEGPHQSSKARLNQGSVDDET